jgi:hypothetical protein
MKTNRYALVSLNTGVSGGDIAAVQHSLSIFATAWSVVDGQAVKGLNEYGS